MTSGSRSGARRVVQIVIGCDTDPDRESLLGPLPAEQLSWRGVTEGIPELKAAVADLCDRRGHAPVFTWLIRADEQIQTLCGDFAWPFRAHADLLRGLVASGDELGWHPHFWRRDAVTRVWYQEVEDVAWQLQMLRAAHAALAAKMSTPLRSVRMGWNYHTRETLATLDALGIVVDFSALPGLRTYSGAPPQRSDNLFDWHGAPRRAYHPAVADHQRAANAGEGSLRLLEMPVFVASSVAWGLVGGLQLARKARDLAPIADAIRRPTYWINLTAKPRLFSPLVRALRAELRRPSMESVVFATYFHPDELIANRSSLYDLPSLRANLVALLEACAAEGAEVEFRQAVEVAQSLVAGPSSAVA